MKNKKDEVQNILSSIKDLRIPTDFDAVHDVKELLSIVQAGNIIKNYFKKYKDEFVRSFFMTADEVLDYIPKDGKNWKVCEGYDHIFEESYKKCKDLSSKLHFISSVEKIFLVDTINKKIEVNWCLLEDKYYKDAGIYEGWGRTMKNVDNISFSYVDRGLYGNEYGDKSEIDEDESTVTMDAKYSEYSRHFIPRNSDWYSGRRTHEWEIRNKDIHFTHKFCMNTNKYLGVTITKKDDDYYMKLAKDLGYKF